MKTTQEADGARRIAQIPKDLVRSLQGSVTGSEDCLESDDVQTESPGRYIQGEFDFERGPESSRKSDDDEPGSVEETGELNDSARDPLPIQFDDIRFVAAGPEDVEAGLLGWIGCTVNGMLRLEDLALRRSAGGQLALSFPARRDGADRQHFYIRPLDDTARREIEHQILRALGHNGDET